MDAHKAETRSKGQIAPLGLRCPRDDGQVGTAPLLARSAAELGKGGLLPRSESAGRAKDLPHLDKRVTVGLKLHPMSTGARASFGQIEGIFADAISAKAGTQRCGAPRLPWVPAFAGDGAMTRVSLFGTRYSVSADR
jgi:hypothetical protein